jgi:hypothetical protein
MVVTQVTCLISAPGGRCAGIEEQDNLLSLVLSELVLLAALVDTREIRGNAAYLKRIRHIYIGVYVSIKSGVV